jgi:hypothetical protein
MLRFIKIITIILSLLLVSPILARAIDLGSLGGGDGSVTGLMVPSVPTPGENVSIELSSNSFNIDTANIVWSVNGKAIFSGKGEKRISVKSGTIGTQTEVVAIIEGPDGSSIKKMFVIIPTAVDMIFEADTYTPAFYSGKALPTSEAKVKVWAIPHLRLKDGTEIPRNELTYTWSVDDEVNGRASGYDKETFSFLMGYLPENSPKISVEVYSQEYNMKAVGELKISQSNPEIIFYEDSPQSGLKLNKAIGDKMFMDGPELTIFGSPYFFSEKNQPSKNFNYKWYINGEEQNNKTTKLTVRKPNTSGKSSVSFSIEGIKKLFQSTKKETTIEYEASNL